MTTTRDLNAGRIVGVFGLRGECKIDATRLGADALTAGTRVFARLRDGSEQELCVRAARMHKGRPLATFEGFADIDSAQVLVGATLALEREAVTLRPGEYLDTDLVGCDLMDLAGNAIGSVVGVEHYPAQDMLVVGVRRALVPMVAAFVHSIDTTAKRIIVDVPPGLLDEREADLG